MKIERRQKKCPVQCTILILLIHRTPCSLGYMRIFVFVLLCWCLFACLLMCPVSYPTLSVSLFRYPSDLLLTLFVSIYVIFVRALDVNMPEIRSLSPSSLFCPFLSCYSCEYLCQKHTVCRVAPKSAEHSCFTRKKADTSITIRRLFPSLRYNYHF